VNIENNIMSAEQHSVFQNFIIRARQVLADTRPIWFIFNTIFFEYTQEESSHNTVMVFGGICPGALSSPIEVNKSVIPFMSPRDFSTNLNEDSNNQKENVVPNKRFRMVTDEETGGFFLEEDWLFNKGIITLCFSYWPSYR
jgi:hypothetical protein